MTDFFGVQAYWYSSPGPDGFGSWYFPPDSSAKVKLTAPVAKDKNGKAVDSGATTIDAFKQQLDNSQPAHLSALADQWQNMHDMLDKIQTQLYDETFTLYYDKWTGGKARDAFVTTGPAPVLAYIDAWKESALQNKTALRAISNIILEYQGKMKPLWDEYTKAVKDAQNVDAYHETLGWIVSYNIFGGSDQRDLDANMADLRAKNTKNVQTTYNIRAQAMAWEMAQALFDTYSPLSAGHGPLYEPPDAVLDDPTTGIHTNFGPGGLPAGPPPAPVLPPIPPPAPPGTPVTTPTGPTVIAPPAPPMPPVPTAPTAPTAPTSAPTAPVLPVLPPGLGGLLPPGLGGGLAEPGLPTVPAGAANPFAAPRVPGSGGLISRSAGDGQADAGLGSMPRAGVLGKGAGSLARRQPGQPEPPGSGRRSGRGNTEEAGIEREPGQEDLFGGKGAATPPVLGNRRRNRSRSTLPPGVMGDEFSTALPQHGDAVPSVFGRDTLAGPAATPVDDAAPALRAAPRQAGPGAVADEVQPALRAATPRESAQREIHGRSSSRAMGTARPVAPEERASIPTDEEAFSVPSPGGGVLTGHQEDRGYSPEPAAQVRAQ